PKINVKYYNETLFEGAKGLFPVELEKQSEPRIDDAEIEKRRSSSAPKIYIVDPEHPITAGIAPLQYSIPDLIFTLYTPTNLHFTWARPGNKKDHLKELITRPNLQRVPDATRPKTQDKFLNPLPVNDPAYKKYQPLLNKHKDALLQLVREARED